MSKNSLDDEPRPPDLISKICGAVVLVTVVALLAPLPIEASGYGHAVQAVWRSSKPIPIVLLRLVPLTIAAAVLTCLVLNRRASAVFITASYLAIYCATSVVSSRGIAEIICWLFFLAACYTDVGISAMIRKAWVALLAFQMVAAIVLYHLPGHRFLTQGFGYRAQGLFESVNLLYTLALIVGLASVCSALWSSGRSKRIGYLLIASLSLIVLVLTFSRGGWLGAVVGIVVVAHAGRSRLRIPAYVAASILLVGALLVRTHGNVVSLRNDRSAASRLVVWREAKDIAFRSPIFGYGYRDYQDLPGASGGQLEPKNLPLSLMLQQGIIGLCLYAAFFTASIRMAYHIINRVDASSDDRAMAATALSCIAAIITTGLFDTPVFGGVERIPATISLLFLVGVLETRSRALGRVAQAYRIRPSSEAGTCTIV